MWPGSPACRVIAKGQVAEQGTHESLAEAGGLYSGLVSAPCLAAPLGTFSLCRRNPLHTGVDPASMLVPGDCAATHPKAGGLAVWRLQDSLSGNDRR